MSPLLFCMECDSENIGTKRIDFLFTLPSGRKSSYKKEIHVCSDCGEHGVLLRKTSKENHARYLSALKEADENQTPEIL